MISLDDFVDDNLWTENRLPFDDIQVDDQIEGLRLQSLISHGDDRGELTVLLSSRYGAVEHSQHVYMVSAAPGSIRAWVYHKRQFDRLAYVQGNFRVVLFDLRTESSTYGNLNVLDLGSANRVLLTIPPFVVHGVQNRGRDEAIFINMPTAVYDPENPDKSRLPFDHSGIPYNFNHELP